MSKDMITETYTLPPAAPYHNEGKTPAGWMMFAAVSVGLAIATIGFLMASWIVMILGVVVIGGGLIASLAMRRAGMGQPLEPATRRDWYDER